MNELQIEQIKEKAEKQMKEELAVHPNYTSELKIKTEQQTFKLKEEILPPSKIAIKPSTLDGYGVFAIEDISKGTVIEEGVYTNTFYRTLDTLSMDFRRVFYTLPCNCEECHWRGIYFVASTGYLQLYNCSKTEEDAQIALDWIIQERCVVIKAIRDIKKGEEILIWYGQEADTETFSRPNNTPS